MLHIYSDAGSYHNGKPDALGSFCSLIVNEENNKVVDRVVKVYEGTTNNYGEIMGVLEGLHHVLTKYPETNHIIVTSDSQYTIKGASEWMFQKWIPKGWKAYDGKEIKNLELWKKMHEFIVYCNTNRIRLEFRWQKGHKGKKITLEENPIIYFQELCDTYATKAIAKAVELRENAE